MFTITNAFFAPGMVLGVLDYSAFPTTDECSIIYPRSQSHLSSSEICNILSAPGV